MLRSGFRRHTSRDAFYGVNDFGQRQGRGIRVVVCFRVLGIGLGFLDFRSLRQFSGLGRLGLGLELGLGTHKS